MNDITFHRPVLLQETLDLLECRTGGVYVDGTVGGGGHSYEILKRTSPDGILIGLDMDDEALAEAGRTLKGFDDRAVLLKSNFSEIKTIIAKLNIEKVDGILLDLGVSSHQLKTGSRGFSFSLDAPLDMRMDRQGALTAYDIVNSYSERELKRIIRDYGEERRTGRIVRAILEQRRKSPITTTTELAGLVSKVVPHRSGGKMIHPATRTFQALRIAVNDELENLRICIEDGIDILNKGGVFAIISFHSLEDRIVKNLFRSWEKGCVCPPDFPVCTCGRESKLWVLTKRPVKPGVSEMEWNPRARSARLRAAKRI